MIYFNELIQNEFVIMFLIATLGYALGRIKICGLAFGTSGVLLVALVFGHFGLLVPTVIRNFGLIVFVASVGLMAGPTFFQCFKEKAVAYILLGVIIIFSGFLLTGFVIKVVGVPVDLAAGMFTGALTSTPGLAAATEAVGDEAATGYGIAYPFGVVGVVLFVQLVPKFLQSDLIEEARLIEQQKSVTVNKKKRFFEVEHSGMFPLAVTIVLGMVLAELTIPLPGGVSFSLGTSGGPLVAGLFIGHFKQIGGLSLEAPQKTLEIMREAGLMLFLMGAGTQAGQGIVEILREQGLQLFLWGAVITLVPMLVGYLLGRKLFKLQLLNTLGAITGGMTSTPALGAMVAVTKTSAVGVSYAATYPVALVMVVICAQLIPILWG